MESETSPTLMVKARTEWFHPSNLMMERETSSNSSYLEKIKMADKVQKITMYIITSLSETSQLKQNLGVCTQYIPQPR